MKLCYDYQIFSAQRYGGISRYFFEIANHLAGATSEGVESKIICPLFINEYINRTSGKIKINGLKVPAGIKAGRIYS